MISRVRRRKVDTKTAARWLGVTRDQEKLHELYAPLAEEDRALAEAGLEDLARSLAEIDEGAPQT